MVNSVLRASWKWKKAKKEYDIDWEGEEGLVLCMERWMDFDLDPTWQWIDTSLLPVFFLCFHLWLSRGFLGQAVVSFWRNTEYAWDVDTSSSSGVFRCGRQ